LTKALDGLALRGSAIAENIANAGAPAYRPVRVSFERALRSAASGGLVAIDAVRPKLETLGAADTLRLDLQVADAAQTAQRYGAVAEILNRQLQLDGLAITGNG
jgi:flagellar basal-body rod protein FlgB